LEEDSDKVAGMILKNPQKLDIFFVVYSEALIEPKSPPKEKLFTTDLNIQSLLFFI